VLRDELWEKLKQLPKDDLDQGITLMQQYLQESVNDATIMSELAYWFYRKGDNKSLEQALSLCDASLLQQDNWETIYIMGLVTMKLGDDLFAISCFEKVRKVNSIFPDAHYALGKIYFEIHYPTLFPEV
jgi:tetratricopeptide (TPR) repeat protein